MANFTAGKYLVELTGQQGFSETGTGNPQFFMKFLVQYRWNFSTGQWEGCEGAERTFYRVLTPKTAEYAAEDLRALGFQGDKFSQLDPRHPQAHVFQGQIEMSCSIEDYTDNQGVTKPKEKWSIVKNGGGREEKVLDNKGVKSIDMLYGKALAAAPKQTPQPPTPPTQQTAQRPALVSQPRPQQQRQPENKPGHGTTDEQPPPPKENQFGFTGSGNAAPANANGVTDDDLPF